MSSRLNIFARRPAAYLAATAASDRRHAERPEHPATRRPTVSAGELERLYNYGTLLRVR